MRTCNEGHLECFAFTCAAGVACHAARVAGGGRARSGRGAGIVGRSVSIVGLEEEVSGGVRRARSRRELRVGLVGNEPWACRGRPRVCRVVGEWVVINGERVRASGTAARSTYRVRA